MEPSGQGPGPSSATGGGPHPNSPNSPSMEIPTLVSSVTGNVCGPSQIAPSGGQPNSINTSPIETRPSAPASRVEYLRQRYKHQQLLEKATELILASWREKSSKTYESQFQTWASWCGARSIDPISCPIGDVANFLAEMFSKGYQYRSIDAYRSAISSVHDKIDGYDVGQHPLISRLLKGIFHQRPPQPRYTHTWDVGVVTAYIRANSDRGHSWHYYQRYSEGSRSEQRSCIPEILSQTFSLQPVWPGSPIIE